MHAYNGVLTILGLAHVFVFPYRLNFLFLYHSIIMCLCAFCLKRPFPKWPILCWARR